MPSDPKSSPAQFVNAGRNARYGLGFFAIYCVLYAGFMGLTAFTKVMSEPVAGVNWAIVYGMGLIVAALVLAVAYMFVCNPAGEHADTQEAEARK